MTTRPGELRTGKRRFWPIGLLCYAVVTPLVGWAYHGLFIFLLGAAIGFGDTASGRMPAIYGIPYLVLSFPMMYLWFPIGEWLKPSMGDNAVLFLFAKINAFFWGSLVALLIVWIARLIWKRLRPAHVCQACGYDLRGNPRGPCPECGAART